MTAPDRPSAPDLVDPVVGYRQWRLEAGRLRSPFSGTLWETPVLSARCAMELHEPGAAPATDCTCGIYAYYDPCPRTASLGGGLISGAVVLWGEIELHGNGMRAARCRIVALERPGLPGRKRAGALRAAGVLGIPCVAHRRLPVEAARYGLPLPGLMRPARYRPLPGAAGRPLPAFGTGGR